MSTFKTAIPVDTDAIKKLLPAGASVEQTTWDGKALHIQWHHQRLVTPYTFPVEFSIDQLKAQSLPDGVKRRDLPTLPPTNDATTPPPAPTAKPARKPRTQKAKLP